MPSAQKVIGVGVTGATAAGSATAVVPAPYDVNIQITAAAATAATIILPATLGKRWLVHSLAGSIFSIPGALTTAVAFTVADGATIIWAQILSLPISPATSYLDDKVTAIGLALIGTPNTAMTINIAAPVAGIQALVSVGAYLI